MPTATEILRQLVAIPTVSTLSNIPLLDAVSSLLEPHGWVTRKFPLPADTGIAKANMLVVPGQFVDSLPHLDLLFVCHTDTVPFRSEWEGALQLEERGELLHGCGACDVKGSLAGLVAAALRVNTANLRTSIGFALTADEEIGCLGAIKLIASGAVQPHSVIVCEPTSLHPATAGKGYSLAEVCVRGHEAHSAFPAKGVSAIAVAARVIVQIEQLASVTPQTTDMRFNPPHTTFNVGIIKGGTAKNIVAGECTFLVEWRPLPQEDPQAGVAILQHIASGVEAAYPGCAIRVSALRADQGFINAPTSSLGGVLSNMLGLPETGISFGSEATRFSKIADEVIVIGPGDMETAHSERECVPQLQLDLWVDTVQYLLLHGCNHDGGSS